MKGPPGSMRFRGVLLGHGVCAVLFVMMKNGGFVPTMELVMAKHPNLFQIGWAGGKVWSYPMIFGMASAMALGCVCFPQPLYACLFQPVGQGPEGHVSFFWRDLSLCDHDAHDDRNRRQRHRAGS